ncbi:MAG: LysM peptidoglycan-binding domain-containing protein, partial [Gammaproteobacteria bacterium]|nr:LysM peptidoglycan-binding domain-containing protein [Gammaproteobacteria bacterium]
RDVDVSNKQVLPVNNSIDIKKLVKKGSPPTACQATGAVCDSPPGYGERSSDYSQEKLGPVRNQNECETKNEQKSAIKSFNNDDLSVATKEAIKISLDDGGEENSSNIVAAVEINNQGSFNSVVSSVEDLAGINHEKPGVSYVKINSDSDIYYLWLVGVVVIICMAFIVSGYINITRDSGRNSLVEKADIHESVTNKEILIVNEDGDKNNIEISSVSEPGSVQIKREHGIVVINIDNNQDNDFVRNKEQASLSVRDNDVEKHEVIHCVVKGDTLWAIASRYIKDPYRYPELARLSKIKNPHRIYPGDKVRVVLE